MIGKLKGLIDTIEDETIILDVQGVGYLVTCPSPTLDHLSIGEAATLFIETHVREDQIRLFGFTTTLEQQWFRLLQTVQGVGAKVALAILSTLKPNDLASAIAMGDKATIARAPGVVPKVAQRIAVELKDKTPTFINIDPATLKLSQTLESKNKGPAADAVSALMNLGYGQPQAIAAVAAAQSKDTQEQTTQSLIRQALKELAQ